MGREFLREPIALGLRYSAAMPFLGPPRRSDSGVRNETHGIDGPGSCRPVRDSVAAGKLGLPNSSAMAGSATIVFVQQLSVAGHVFATHHRFCDGKKAFTMPRRHRGSVGRARTGAGALWRRSEIASRTLEDVDCGAHENSDELIRNACGCAMMVARHRESFSTGEFLRGYCRRDFIYRQSRQSVARLRAYFGDISTWPRSNSRRRDLDATTAAS